MSSDVVAGASAPVKPSARSSWFPGVVIVATQGFVSLVLFSLSRNTQALASFSTDEGNRCLSMVVIPQLSSSCRGCCKTNQSSSQRRTNSECSSCLSSCQRVVISIPEYLQAKDLLPALGKDNSDKQN